MQDSIELEAPGVPFTDNNYMQMANAQHPKFEIRQDEMGPESDTEPAFVNDDAVPDEDAANLAEAEMEAEQAQIEVDEAKAALDDQVAELEADSDSKASSSSGSSSSSSASD